MQTLHLTPSTMDTQFKTIARKCFPSYSGRKFKVAFYKPSSLASYWDGGSRDYYVLYDLDTGKTLPVPSNHPAFERQAARASEAACQAVHERPNVLVVGNSIFCGKDSGITFYCDEQRVRPMLPRPLDVGNLERIVLQYTSGYRNTYGGETNIRFNQACRETGISADGWRKGQELCLMQGWLRKNGSMTPEGRNALASV